MTCNWTPLLICLYFSDLGSSSVTEKTKTMEGLDHTEEICLVECGGWGRNSVCWIRGLSRSSRTGIWEKQKNLQLGTAIWEGRLKSLPQLAFFFLEFFQCNYGKQPFPCTQTEGFPETWEFHCWTRKVTGKLRQLVTPGTKHWQPLLKIKVATGKDNTLNHYQAFCTIAQIITIVKPVLLKGDGSVL